MSRPRDPAFPGITLDDCVRRPADDGIPDDGIPGSVRVAAGTRRATAMRFFADEASIGFRDVQCVTRYARLLTRQDVWDYSGRERWADQQAEEPEENGARYRDGEWRWPDGSLVEFPEPPDEPPADWKPLDDDPAWETCKPDAPGAVKVYICEERPR